MFGFYLSSSFGKRWKMILGFNLFRLLHRVQGWDPFIVTVKCQTQIGRVIVHKQTRRRKSFSSAICGVNLRTQAGSSHTSWMFSYLSQCIVSLAVASRREQRLESPTYSWSWEHYSLDCHCKVALVLNDSTPSLFFNSLWVSFNSNRLTSLSYVSTVKSIWRSFHQ